MTILSLNVGRPRLVAWGDGPSSTAINKEPVTGPVGITRLGLAGDHQAHRDVHGGPQLAVCAYPHENYSAAGQFLGAALPVPSFGENMTLQGIDELQACIGDTFRAGTATIQISQPRQPCGTLARKHGRGELVQWIILTGLCGWYFRVLDEGSAAGGDPLVLLDRPYPQWTVRRTLHAMFLDPPREEDLAALSRCDGLSPGWRQRMARRVKRV